MQESKPAHETAEEKQRRLKKEEITNALDKAGLEVIVAHKLTARKCIAVSF